MKHYTTPKGYKVIEFDETLSVCDQLHKRSFYQYLTYDKTRGMNIGCSDVSEIDSLFQALKYYQKRLSEVELELKTLGKNVEDFINKVNPREYEE